MVYKSSNVVCTHTNYAYKWYIYISYYSITFIKNILNKGQIFVVLLFTLSTSVSALTIAPARIDLVAEMGEIVNQEVTLTNTSNEDQTFTVAVESFDPKTTDDSINIKNGLSTWVNIAKSVTVKKGETVKLPYSFTVPRNGIIYSNNAAIFFIQNEPKDGSGSKVGTLISLKISGIKPLVCTFLSKSLKRGVKNNEVFQLQNFLSVEGYLKGSSNGYFGITTLNAVREFQLANGISPVGSVGPITRGKVEEISCSKKT